MADQKDLKKRLKVLMQKPENQVCSDCPERQPRWASLIVPPPGSPPGTLATGAFCCLECSGSHRRLGVHISFVRSINLDSWKEKEVLAMENGGNRKVNAIWEAHLARAGGRKPETGADLATRERFIRDKYERRKFFDPDVFINYHNNEPSIDELVPRGGADFANFGPPSEVPASDAAMQRAEKKKKKAPVRNKSFERVAPARSKSAEINKGRPKNTAEAAEPTIDLLDFGADPTPPPANEPNNGNVFGDFFSVDQNGTAASAPDVRKGAQERPGGRRGVSRSRSNSRGDVRTKSKTPDREKTRKSQQQDILSMYNAPLGGNPMIGAGMGFPAAGMVPPNNMAAVNNTTTNNNNNVNMMATMQYMQNMSLNPQMNQNQPVGGKHNSRLQMHQNLMMQQMQSQMQQQQRNLQQMQRMMQQNPAMMQQMQAQMQMQQRQQMQMQMQPGDMMNNPQMMHGMMPAVGPGGMNPPVMGMMNPMMMNQSNPMMGMNPPPMVNAFGGMPMGRSSAHSVGASATTPNKMPEKDDPFAQFGMNAFR